MVPPKPHVLLISGGCHTPAHFTPLATHLVAHGFTVTNPRLPSNSIVPPNNSFQEDKKLVRGIVEEHANAGEEIIVLMHSYGGFLGSEALVGLGVKERRAKEELGGIKWLAYMAALIPVKGERIVDVRMLNGELATDVNDSHTHSFITDLVQFPKYPAAGFYHDMPEDEQMKWVAELTGFSLDCQRAKLQNEAWRGIDVAYLLCEQDRALQPEVQRKMIDRVLALGIGVKEKRCSSAHSPFLSQPETVVEWLNELA